MVITDPIALQNTAIANIENRAEVTLTDPTNPLVMVTESITKSRIDLEQSLRLQERTTFPALATNELELYPHLSNENDNDFFSSPATAELDLLIPISDILTKGIYDNTKKQYTIIIPKLSTITVDSYTFTIMNDIKIVLIKRSFGYLAYGENIVTADSEFFRYKGILNTYTYKDLDNVDWVRVTVPVVQLYTSIIEATATAGMEFKVSIPLFNKKYFKTHIAYQDNGVSKELKRIYVDSIYDPDTPSVYIEVLPDKINYFIPQSYIDKRLIRGNVTFTMYSTDGKVRLYLSKYKSTDFKFSLPKVLPNIPEVNVMTGISVLAISDKAVNGGVNYSLFKDMKKKILFKTSNVIDKPVTEEQLKEKFRQSGLNITKAVDSILDRVYLVTLAEDINLDTNFIDADVFSESTYIEITDNSTIQDTIKNTDTTLVIEPDTVFKLENGKIVPILKSELNTLTSLPTADAIRELNQNNYFITPYLYIFDKDTSIIESRVYDISSPRFKNLFIKDKNKYLKENCNISGHSTFKTDTGYDIFFNIFGNQDYQNIKDSVRIQLKIPLKDDYVYFESTLDLAKTTEYFPTATEALHYIHIESSNLIAKDGSIPVSNGITTTTDPKNLYIDLSKPIEAIIFTRNTSIIVDDVVLTRSFLGVNNGLIKTTADDVVGLVIESMEFTPYSKLDYLWDKVNPLFTPRRYKTYGVDIPLVYEEDVYQVDIATGLYYKVKDDPTDLTKCIAESNAIIHHKGDPVLDENGNPRLKHKKDDKVVIDGVPQVDKVYGYAFLADILIYDYKFHYISKIRTLDTIENFRSLYNTVLTSTIPELNKITLDRTRVFLKPRRGLSNVELIDNTRIDFISRPRVILYLSEDSVFKETEFQTLKIKIGKIIAKYLYKVYIDVNEIEHEIKDILLYPKGVEINNITPDNRRVLSLSDGSNRFLLPKRITSDLDIEYDYTLDIRYI